MARKRNGRAWTPDLADTKRPIYGWVEVGVIRNGDEKIRVIEKGLLRPTVEPPAERSHKRPDEPGTIRVSHGTKSRILTNVDTGETIVDKVPQTKAERRKRKRRLKRK